MFNRSYLRQIVEIVGRALKKEDAEIRDVLLSNPYYQTNGAMGLRRVDNERFYQFLAWKALASSDLPFCVVPERDYRDLWICSSWTDREPLAIGEMKRWVEPSGGGKELEGIQADIGNLRTQERPGFMLITTESEPPGEKQYQWLAEHLSTEGLPIERRDLEIYEFPTVWIKRNEKRELCFGLIGIMVNSQAVEPNPAAAKAK